MYTADYNSNGGISPQDYAVICTVLRAEEEQARQQNTGLGIEPFTIAAIGAGITKLFGGLLSRGHADDAVDAAEDQWRNQFVVPVAQQVDPAGSYPANRVRDLRAAILRANTANTTLSPEEARGLIAQGDQLEAELCAQFAQAGFPCEIRGRPLDPGVPWSGGTSAGYDIPALWPPLRAKLEEIAARSAGADDIFSQLLPRENGAGSILPLLIGGGGLLWMLTR